MVLISENVPFLSATSLNAARIFRDIISALYSRREIDLGLIRARWEIYYLSVILNDVIRQYE